VSISFSLICYHNISLSLAPNPLNIIHSCLTFEPVRKNLENPDFQALETLKKPLIENLILPGHPAMLFISKLSSVTGGFLVKTGFGVS